MNRYSDPAAALAAATIDAQCRSCRAVVPDLAWLATCQLLGMTYAKDGGMRTCAKCLRCAAGGEPLGRRGNQTTGLVFALAYRAANRTRRTANKLIRRSRRTIRRRPAAATSRQVVYEAERVILA